MLACRFITSVQSIEISGKTDIDPTLEKREELIQFLDKEGLQFFILFYKIAINTYLRYKIKIFCFKIEFFYIIQPRHDLF